MPQTTSREKEKKELIAVVCLVATLACLILYNVHRVNARKAKRSQSLSAVAQAPAVPAAPAAETPPKNLEGTSLASLKEQAKAIEWGRDPFTLVLGKGAELPTLKLQVTGIIYDPIHPEATYAIVNDEVVRIGDNIRGIKVVDIQADAVRFKKFNREFTLQLYEESELPKK